MKKHIYCVSGFGADERVFSGLDVGMHIMHFIPWKTPFPGETIASYAARMAGDIVHPQPVLMGLSFGGMISVEMAKLVPYDKVILLSSVATRHELPFYMKIAGRLYLNRLIPMRPYPFLEPFENYNLGVETPGQKALTREYRKNIDPVYSNWAINEIINWKNDWLPSPVFHIHGGNDHIFPLKKVKADYVIPGAGHLLVMNNAAEVSRILKQVI